MFSNFHLSIFGKNNAGFKYCILFDHNGTDALEYVGMAIVIVPALAPVASHVLGLLNIAKHWGIGAGK